MSKGRSLVVSGLSALALFAAACGGGGNDDVSSLRPKLAGTPLPTATAIPPTPVVCDVPSPIGAPTNLPTDVAIPKGYVISSLATAPQLSLSGRVELLPNPNAPVEEAGLSAHQLLERRTIETMRSAWQFDLNERVDGRDYSFTATDGRKGHLNIAGVGSCPNHVSVTFDFYWITPVAGN